MKTARQLTSLQGRLFPDIRMTHVATAVVRLKGPKARPGRRFVVMVMTTALLIVCETLRTQVVVTLEKVVGMIMCSVARRWAVFTVQEFLCSDTGIVCTVLLSTESTQGMTTMFTIRFVDSRPKLGRSGNIPRKSGAIRNSVKQLNMTAGTLVSSLSIGP